MAPSLLRLWPLALAAACGGAAAGGEEVEVDWLAPEKVEACRSRAELEAWRQHAEAHLRSFAPEGVRPFALRTVQESYSKRLAELEGRGPASTPGAPARELPGEPEDGDYRLYLAKHAGDFERCVRLRQRVPLPRGPVDFPVLLATADMCHMERDLHVWRSCQLAEVREHVPSSYQRFVVDILRAQYKQQLKELAPEGAVLADWMAQLAATAPQLPAFLAVAAVCNSEAELRTWRAHELAQIQATVPKEYQRFATTSVERTFTRRMKQLASQPPAMPAPATAGAPLTTAARMGAPAATMELADKSTGMAHLHAKAALLVLCGLAIPAVFSFLEATFSTRRGQVRKRVADPADEGFHLQEV